MSAEHIIPDSLLPLLEPADELLSALDELLSAPVLDVPFVVLPLDSVLLAVELVSFVVPTVCEADELSLPVLSAPVVVVLALAVCVSFPVSSPELSPHAPATTNMAAPNRHRRS